MPSLATESTRRAALRWLSELRVAGVPRVRVLLTNHPRYADLTPAQYAEGFAWLRRTGMVTAAGQPVVEVSDGELWEDVTADEVPRVLWNQAAEDAKRAVGAAGEQALLRVLRQGGVPHVRHVAAESDAYGYDIEAAGSVPERAHIEVKATTDPTRLVVHLTRHEYEVMAADADWCLAAVLVDSDGNAASVATVDRGWLHSTVPTDQERNGRWESVRLTVPVCALTPGLATETWVLLPDGLLPSASVWALPGVTSGSCLSWRASRPAPCCGY
ncbi:protein NO VEIN domain-containing protein [Streptomyces sp. NPDC051064]|uniref:protein NO VEIN domain-containing protein n=1 Tax=Streptomyces sp. NPDC051064 TaxID=3365641 RepID=UPI0037AE7EEA